MKALLGKISPVATYYGNQGPFDQSVKTGEYMLAYANPYVLGTDKANFTVTFGNVTLDENQVVSGFMPVGQFQMEVDSAVLDTWGTDDSVILHAIAQLAGTTVTETVNADLSTNNF